MSKRLSILVVFLLSPAAPANAADEVTGPVAAEILRVIDGDTLLVEASPWPQQKVEVYVRIRGIDAPEIRSRCEAIRQAGEQARRALQALATPSRAVLLTRIAGDKYFGRIVADVTLEDGHDVANHLLLAGLAVSYDGGTKSRQGCQAE